MLIPQANQAPGQWSGGTTQTIYLYPTEADLGAGDYLFWVNTATIEREAAYSYFPGYQRFHLILSSPGLHLHFAQPDEIVELAQFDSYLFDGGRPLRAKPIGPPVTAFNIIMKTGLTATVQRIFPSPDKVLLADWVDGADEAETIFYLLYGILGQITLTANGVEQINPGDAYLISPKNRAKVIASQASLQTLGDKAHGLWVKIALPTKT